jgi:YhcH/YjgK/YiaL family protein
MIIDLLDNIETYKTLSPDIYLGLKFLSSLRPDIIPGIYPIGSRVKAIVTEYITIQEFEKGYEAHKHMIDIQYPVIGLERVKWSPISRMKLSIPYDELNDVAYYSFPSEQSTYVDIGNGIFAIMFPEDGHSPQHYIDAPHMIKKITIKVEI